jgi:hypothetical protein
MSTSSPLGCSGLADAFEEAAFEGFLDAFGDFWTASPGAQNESGSISEAAPEGFKFAALAKYALPSLGLYRTSTRPSCARSSPLPSQRARTSALRNRIRRHGMGQALARGLAP